VSSTVGVLGVGGVGGAIAARLAAAGHRVVCVATPASAAAIRATGLELEAPDGIVQARPEAVEHLEEPVGLLVVAVKAPSLAEALERIEVFAVADGVALTLLNGLEHPEIVRRRLGPRVAPGSISRFQAHAIAPGRIVQETAVPLVTAASDDFPTDVLDRALAPLRDGHVDFAVADDERAVLWQKAARLAPLAAATVASGLTVGGLRSAPAWRARLEAAVGEAVAVAVADGVAMTPESQLAIIEAMPATLWTSTARDAANGRPSELDAIAGSVLRAGDRLGVPCPVLEALVAEART
jgi:2-dehydropantoate 2-reductase